MVVSQVNLKLKTKCQTTIHQRNLSNHKLTSYLTLRIFKGCDKEARLHPMIDYNKLQAAKYHEVSIFFKPKHPTGLL